MDWLKKVSIPYKNSFVALMTLLLVSACGGSGGELGAGTGTGTGTGGTPPPPPPTNIISVVLAISTTDVTADTPATVTATVSDSSSVLSGEVVTFSSSIGTLSPESGTALTDANGVATIILNAGTVAGAGSVTATLGTGESSSISFQTAGDDNVVIGDVSVSLALVSSVTGLPIDTISSTVAGQLVATVVGITSQQIVTFSITQGAAGSIPIPTAITDINNQATVDILAGSQLGAIEVTASLQTGEFDSLPLAVGATNLTMGSGTPFQAGVAELSSVNISAGGTSTVIVEIRDDAGNLFTQPIDVNFSSGCSRLTTPTASLSSPVSAANGIASSTYRAQGCVGPDTINVTSNAGGINLSATGTVTVLPASVGSIEFVSATPENIAIQGAGGLGGSENSTVLFRVRDINGSPVNGSLVDFSLNTQVGGISFSPASASSDAQGLVQTVVNSGTVAASVRVTATIRGTTPLISSQSSNLVVSTGIPDQDSFSLSADILNPEGWDIDGNTVNVTARLSDAFNNPVPDGTSVSFTTEGGSIEPSCLTENGACSVTWTSTNPRPEGQTLVGNLAPPEVFNTLGQKFGGRATILATAIGEESFPDLNGNGRFDAGVETTAFAGTDISGNPFDLDEAFVDHNEDGIYNPAITGGQIGGELETFVDFDASSGYSTRDGVYNGVLCSIPAHAGCAATQKSINVRARLVLVMSGSNPGLFVANTIDSPNIGAAADIDTSLVLDGEATGSVNVIIADLHNQPMPQGTTITFTPTVGTIVGPSTFSWPNDNHNGGRAFGVSVKGATQPASGSLLIEVQTPSGLNTVFSPVTITIL